MTAASNKYIFGILCCIVAHYFWGVC